MTYRHPVILDPPHSPAGTPAELLQDLAAALDGLGPVLASALARLTVDETELALNSLTLTDRQNVMRALGFRKVVPRSFGHVLSDQVLKRLRLLESDSEQRHVASYLTTRIAHDAVSAVHGQAGANIGRWGDHLVLLALFSRIRASALDAEMLVWAAGHGWFGADLDAAAAEAVSDAARQVVDEVRALDTQQVQKTGENSAAPTAVPSPRGNPDTTAERASAEPGREGERGHDPGRSGPPAAERESGTRLAEELEQAGRTLQHTIGEARHSVERVRNTLSDGAAPDDSDVAAIAAVAPAFARARSMLSAAGSPDTAERLTDLLAAIEAAGARVEQNGESRRLLAAVQTLGCAPGSAVADVIADATQRAGHLLATSSWDADDEAEIRTLGLLVRLVELRERPDSGTAIVETQQQLTLAHPPYAIAAVLHEQITVATTGAPEAPEAPHDTEPATEAAEPPSPARPPVQAGPEAATAAAPESERPPAERSTTATDHTPAEPATVQPPQTAEEPPPVSADGQSQASEPDVEGALARLIGDKRFGLAARLSHAAGRPEAETAVLRLAAASELLNPRSDRAARYVEDSLREWDAQQHAAAGGLELLLLPVLVRAALATGSPVVGAQLRALSQHLPDALQQIAAEVAERTLSSALLMAPLHTVVADASQAEGRLQEAVEACRSLLVPPRMRFQRASQMVKQWLMPQGLLGGVLTAVVKGAPDAGERARALLDRLERPARIEDEIDRMDSGLRGSGGRVIHGPGRSYVRQFVERVRDAVWEWHTAQHELGIARSEQTGWAADSVAGLRLSLLGLRVRAGTELTSAGRRGRPVAGAAALAGAELLELVLGGLEAATAPAPVPTETEVGELLDVELYKVPEWPGAEPTVTQLLTAVDREWNDAIDLRIAQDSFSAVRFILRLAEAGLLPAAGDLEPDVDRPARLAEAEQRRQRALCEKAGELAAELRRAQADGALTDEQDVRLQELLADSTGHTESGEPRELAAVRRNLDRVAELLPHYRKEAADRLRARLDALTDISEKDRERVRHNLDDDVLSTAAELVYFLELGERVPDIRTEESHLEMFFPAVPDALPGGITPELIEAVRCRRPLHESTVLDYSSLSVSEAERAADALERWSRLASSRDRAHINPRVDLTPALSLLGIEATKAPPLRELRQGKDYRFFELTEITVNGRAWAPAFGSQLKDRGDKVRALLIWGSPPAQLLISRIAQDPDESSLLVVHFGTLDNRTRVELAAASQSSRPVLVVDDAALAYLTARGKRSVDAATETLLPFSGVNPYIKEKRGQIGREMFYGRDRERKSILDPNGTQIIYGGRGLGKSALLADAGDRFVEQRPGNRKLYLNLDKIGIGKGIALGAAAIWPTLDQELTKVGVLDEPRRRGPRKEPWERVTEGIAQWLAQDADRRLLILLDECDSFFEADVPDCNETRRLRGLGEGENARGRAKVVFAGLHSVQRFTRLARNGPFSHLAQTPTVVGPLTPQFAADLIVHPMRALGFEFSDVDLVNRVLGYCSYQPFLLQIFGSRMVQVMQDKRARQPLAPPPYTIEAADVDEVEQDASLRSDITAAFKDTLALDDRYNVVANVLAQHARDNGLETRLSDRELRDECAGWWPQGFDKLDSEGFRAYLQEMVGLGVLAPNHDGQGWHLRGPNALRMIGTAQEIEARLWSAERESRLEEAVVLESRPGLDGGRRSAPLTINQIDYLLGAGGNQVRVVLGTQAVGIGDVERTLRDATGRVTGWAMPPIGSAGAYRKALVDGRSDGERRLVVSDLVERGDKPCRESLELARTVLPDAPEATRSVVLISSAAQLGFWRELLTDSAIRWTDGDDITVVLRRYDLRSLRDWAQDRDGYETEERQARLAAVTGGWPYLLDRVTDLREQYKDQDRALSELEERLGRPDGAEELVTAVGLWEDGTVWAGYTAIVEQLGTGWNPDVDCVAAAELAGLAPDDARWALICLETLQALDREGGRLRVEPVLHRALSVLSAEQ
ncbi:hypothetical protein ACWCQJ_18390 [Streptomyces olivaceus]